MYKYSKKYLLTALSLVTTSALISGCAPAGANRANSATNNASGPVTLSTCGKTITFDSPPRKIVSIGVTGLSYLSAAGAQDLIIGRANEYGEEPVAWIKDKAQKIPILADTDMSMEKLVALQPDLVYGGGFDPGNFTPDQVSAKGLRAVVDEPECHYFFSDQKPNESYSSILAEISRIGKLAGTSDYAEKTVAELTTNLEHIRKDNPGQGKRVTFVYYFGEDAGLYSYGAQGVMGEMMNILGLTTGIDPNYHPHQGPISPEAFIQSDPDLIIILTGMGGATKESSLERLHKIPGFDQMRAVKQNKIYDAESAIAYASPTAIQGTIELSKKIKG